MTQEDKTSLIYGADVGRAPQLELQTIADALQEEKFRRFVYRAARSLLREKQQQNATVGDRDEFDARSLESWDRMWLDFLMSLFSIYGDIFSSIEDNKIPVRDTDLVRFFWEHFLMARVQRSIWTTNVPGQQVMGRASGASAAAAIEVQKAAIEDGVGITRVFIFDRTDVKSLPVLQRIMLAQMRIGIEVRRIEQEAFGTWNAGVEVVGSEDFMIVDDKEVYVTSSEGSTVPYGLMLKELRVLEAAQSVRKNIEMYSEVVTSDNLGDWPVPD